MRRCSKEKKTLENNPLENPRQAALLKLNLLNLLENPPQGSFDLDHLTALQQALWRNIPQGGGGLRRPDQACGPLRRRESITHAGHSFELIFVHSAMTAEDHELLLQRLQQLKVAEGRQMKSREFAQLLTDSWAELYYLYPFTAGNEAVLALFLKLFALECGFSTPFDYLYLNEAPLMLPSFKSATAVRCGRLARQHFPDDGWLGLLRQQEQYLADTYPLGQIFEQTVVPFRAFAFNHLVHDASARAEGSLEAFLQQLQQLTPALLQGYPELGPWVHSFVSSVRLTLNSGSTPQAQEETLNKLAQKCQEELAAGFIKPQSLLMGGRKFGRRL